MNDSLQRLNALEESVADLREAQTATQKALLDAVRESHALKRVLMAAVALAARGEEEPLRFADEVRHMALGPMESPDLAETRERIELILSKIEGALIKR